MRFMMTARYASECIKDGCAFPVVNGFSIQQGQAISWTRSGTVRGAYHTECASLPFKARQTGPVFTAADTANNPVAASLAANLATVDTALYEKPEPHENPPSKSSGGADAALGALAVAIAPYLEAKLRAKLDAADVEEIVQVAVLEALENHKKTIVLENPATGETREISESTHVLFEKVLRLVRLGVHVYLYGKPGGGKSHVAQQVAKAFNLRFGYISLTAQTSESRVIGFLDANGNFSNPIFHDFYKNGGLMCIDEMDNAHGNLQTAINSALANGHASFPCGMVAKHSDFRLVATGNTNGLGADRIHTERLSMSQSFRDRFTFLEWEYDPALEMEVSQSRNPNAKPWVKWIQSVRKWADVHDPRFVVSPRASQDGALLLRDSAFTVSEVADMALFKGKDKDTVAKILASNPLPVVSRKLEENHVAQA